MDMETNSRFWPQPAVKQFNDREEMALILLRAKDYIERGWCQGTTGQTGNDGTRCNPRSRDARRWCLIGAIGRASDTRDAFSAQRVLRIVRHVIGTENMARWNDAPARTREEVVEALAKCVVIARHGEIP